MKINAPSHVKCSFFHIIFMTHIENRVTSRINFNLTDKRKTYLNPDFDQVYGLVKRGVDDCTQRFDRFR